ncbi:MAG: hypothetical protein RMX96_23085 [Nostoc sp. ChiSLP02]|nr:hypothetical protein [Nostoc sp. DedSLP05]MDZ8103276.1 hypothetical protein [Nostoc sp. DedSLP01]MDZ8187723.1 hypothetical protein [Nostoc sp. ChiSLP02]
MLPCGNAFSEQVGRADDSRLKSGNPPTALSPQRTGSSTQTITHLRGFQNLNFPLVRVVRQAAG